MKVLLSSSDDRVGAGTLVLTEVVQTFSTQENQFVPLVEEDEEGTHLTSIDGEKHHFFDYTIVSESFLLRR